jgi:phage portal protein BeeE
VNLLDRMKRGSRDISTLDDYANLFNQFGFQGIGYGLGGYGASLAPSPLQTTLGGQLTEMAPNTFVGLAQGAYATNGVVFACMMVRQLIFSSIRFQWQRMRNGHASDLYGTPDLALLERPWIGGTTQDMLGRFIQDADLAGNSYWYRDTKELVRLRPDFVNLVVAPRMMPNNRGQIGWKLFGYVYYERGYGAESEPVGFTPDEVVHFAPIPDPLANFRGMSWLTPILREIQADHAMSRHQLKFFDNGATPNLVIKHDTQATLEKIKKFGKEMEAEFGGLENAYKSLHLYPGADATVVGANMRQIDFKQVRGGGETRIAAAAGIPPIIVGLSEGLEAATYANYGQARRRLADGTAHPLWQNLAGSIETVMKLPDSSTRLWYDATDVPFLREDEGDAANIANVRSTTINTYITAGFEPDSVVKAVDSGDLGLLKHTGLVSVQLNKPGDDKVPPPTDVSDKDPSKGNGAPSQPVETPTGGKKNGATVPANA